MKPTGAALKLSPWTAPQCWPGVVAQIGGCCIRAAALPLDAVFNELRCWGVFAAK